MVWKGFRSVRCMTTGLYLNVQFPRGGMLTLLSDCKLAIWVVGRSDSGAEAPRSCIEARIQHALENRVNKLQDTYMARGLKHTRTSWAMRWRTKLSKQASVCTRTRVGRSYDTSGPESVGHKSESRGQRGELEWPVGLVQKAPVGILGPDRIKEYRTWGC